ncbi:MAG: transglutaminase domain-containing protein [Candidatus Bathyarchaeia archaeon]
MSDIVEREDVLSKSSLAAFLLLILAGIESYAYVRLQTDHTTIVSSYEALKLDFADLRNQHRNLDDEYHNLTSDYEDLSRDHLLLQDDFNDLEQAKWKLQMDYDSLEATYTNLQRDYEVLSIGNSLESFYDFLRLKKRSTLYSYQGKSDFAAKLAAHDLGENCWPSIESEYNTDVGEHSYQRAREKIDAAIDLIGIDTYDSSTAKIRKILDFIFDHVSYEAEVDSGYLAPVETIAFRSGDCDDFTILAAALFESVNIDAAFGIFGNEGDELHAMVLVHLDQLVGYGYWSFEDLTDKGLDEGRWIIIEPQYPIEYQNEDSISEWNLLVATEIE